MKRWRFDKNLITQVTPHLSRLVSSKTISKTRIKHKTKKMSTPCHLVLLKFWYNQYCLEFPYCLQIELLTNWFLTKFHQFTDQKFPVTGITKNVKILFSLKDKNSYPTCQIFKGACVFEKSYIGETIWNVDIGWNKHEDLRKESEPAKPLRENLNHRFKWNIQLQASRNYRQQKSYETSFIAIMGPTLNSHLNMAKLDLFLLCHLWIFQLIVNFMSV